MGGRRRLGWKGGVSVFGLLDVSRKLDNRRPCSEEMGNDVLFGHS